MPTPPTRLLLTLALTLPLHAQNRINIDATTPSPTPHPITATLGTSRSPTGQTLGANSDYLTLDGQPWLPVMGEFHFSRYPAAQWEEEILKMKAAGVQIIASYIIWIHHEQTQGVWNWSGQRDLHAFAELCRKHGMYFYPRIGPWAHAEVRNGGIPDWAMKASPIRQSDPIYLKEVDSFYQQIAAQLQGELWKDGGPVIGLQIENEYNKRGAGQGEDHIRTLKRMAIADGLDVPFYTVTGWDGAAIPLTDVLPVFGGYPDAPWDGSPKNLPPNEVYAFRFTNRSAGSMGAIGGSGQNAASTYRGTPFLTAEIGDGIEDTYFRRPVVTPDDVAAIPSILLGSGANMLGYYMFHGGRNPEAAPNPDGTSITLQESQRTAYPTDVPVKSYDFQAPLGEYGQVRESLRKLKLIHYFLNDFGFLLAPMSPRAPAQVPASPADLATVRIAARTAGDTGFVFFNNYVRGAQMPARPGFQVALDLPGGTASIPAQPITLPANTYGIWPVNLALPNGQTLRYTTTQLFKRVVNAGQTYLFFFAIPGIAPEFSLSNTTQQPTLRKLSPNTASEIQLPGGVHLVLLPQSQAEQIWRTDDPTRLLSSSATVLSDGPTWTLQSQSPDIHLGIFGSTANPSALAHTLKPTGMDGLFHTYTIHLPELDLKATLKQTHPAGPRAPWQDGPTVSWRPKPIPMAPDDRDFATAAQWSLQIPPIPAAAPIADLFVDIRYQGDAARLSSGPTLLDDDFWNGLPWTIGLRELAPTWRTAPPNLQLTILPLPRTYPMYIEQSPALVFTGSTTTQAAPIVKLVPTYQLVLQSPTPSKQP
jgi:beta-galactosidase